MIDIGTFLGAEAAHIPQYGMFARLSLDTLAYSENSGEKEALLFSLLPALRTRGNLIRAREPHETLYLLNPPEYIVCGTPVVVDRSCERAWRRTDRTLPDRELLYTHCKGCTKPQLTLSEKSATGTPKEGLHFTRPEGLREWGARLNAALSALKSKPVHRRTPGVACSKFAGHSRTARII